MHLYFCHRSISIDSGISPVFCKDVERGIFLTTSSMHLLPFFSWVNFLGFSHSFTYIAHNFIFLVVRHSDTHNHYTYPNENYCFVIHNFILLLFVTLRLAGVYRTIPVRAIMTDASILSLDLAVITAIFTLCHN